jgi:hypothetical protein
LLGGDSKSPFQVFIALLKIEGCLRRSMSYFAEHIWKAEDTTFVCKRLPENGCLVEGAAVKLPPVEGDWNKCVYILKEGFPTSPKPRCEERRDFEFTMIFKVQNKGPADWVVEKNGA